MSDNQDNRPPESTNDDAVGYGKPPRASRFQNGQSGNPRGRPKGVKNLSTILEEELEQRVIVKENGRHKTITKRRATMKQLVNKAASGEHRSIQILINYLQDLEKRVASTAETPQLGELEQDIVAGVLERLLRDKPNDKEDPNE